MPNKPNQINMIIEVAHNIGLDLSKPINLSPRAQHIVDHYQAEVDKGHMSRNTALDRCLGDLAGRNYSSVKDQRAEVQL